MAVNFKEKTLKKLSSTASLFSFFILELLIAFLPVENTISFTIYTSNFFFYYNN